MMTLNEFQHAFARALMAAPGAEPPMPLATLTSQPGFAVYRNTVMKSDIDALQANYPAVARITGEEWFRAAAARYVREAPPDNPALVAYGASFSAFLARFEPAREMPYLPGVARMDRMWTEAHIARDDATLQPAILASMAPATLATAVVYPHSAARWSWFNHAPVYSIWSHNRDNNHAASEPWEPEWKAEGALLTRSRSVVKWLALDAATHTFLDHCAMGGTVATGVAAVHNIAPDANLQQIMATLLGAGAFSRVSATCAR